MALTRAHLDERIKTFESRLEAQTAEREKARVMLERMDAAVLQLQGALHALRELAAEFPPEAE